MYRLEYVAGVDEVGRGPLAGAVYAAAVVLDPFVSIEGLRDSKMLTEKRRIELDEEIRCKAVAYSIALADVAEIDDVNIFQEEQFDDMTLVVIKKCPATELH